MAHMANVAGQWSHMANVHMANLAYMTNVAIEKYGNWQMFQMVNF